MTLLTPQAFSFHNFEPKAGPAEFNLVGDDGRVLNVAGTDWTHNLKYRWSGTREQAHRMLERLPEGLRQQLRPRQVTFPRRVGRA